MSERDHSYRLGREDGQLVDLVDRILVDPDLHTDARIRLHREIREILRRADARAAISEQRPESG